MGLPVSPQQQAWPSCPAVTEGWTRMWDFLSPSLTSEDSTRICATKEMGFLG